MGKKVQPKHTLDIIESIITGTAIFKPWSPFEQIEIMDIDGFDPSLDDPDYREEFIARFRDRINFISSRATIKGGVDMLPEDAQESLSSVLSKLM